MEVKIFYCYAHEDKKLRMELEKHLRNLEQQKLITGWSDRNINAGSVWVSEISSNLDTANIILLLISKNFMNSEYCTSIEMKRALERHENGTAKVIPIILRDGDYEGALFSHLQALPTDAVPITHRKWHNQDEAFLDVAKGIRKVVKELLSEEFLYEGNIYIYRQQYDEAIKAFEQAIFHNPSNALAYIGKGQALYQTTLDDFLVIDDDYKKILAVFEKAIELEPTNPLAFIGKGDASLQIVGWSNQRNACNSYKQAIKLDPNNETANIGLGNSLLQMNQSEEALVAYLKAIDISSFPNKAAYQGRIRALYSLNRFQEVIVACQEYVQKFLADDIYEIWGLALYCDENFKEAQEKLKKAISLGHTSYEVYNSLGNTLFQLDLEQEAIQAFEKAISISPSSSSAYRNKANVLKYLAEQASKVAETKEESEEHPF